jgi:hypothetical protein
MANGIQPFASESGVSPQERGTSTQPFLIAQAAEPGPKENPWSAFIPFPKGTVVQVEGKMTLLLFLDVPFKGSGRIDELTDSRLDFSAKIAADVPAIFDVSKDAISISFTITYVGEGSNNTAAFSINGQKQQKRVHIQSTKTERVLTPPGGLEIPTNLPSPAPQKVAIREVRLTRAGDRVTIKVGMTAPIPDFEITAFKQ